MDDFWPRHRSFILKILAGLGVCLVAWIVGSSLSDEGLPAKEARAATLRAEISRTAVPGTATIREAEEAVERLRDRIRFIAPLVAETREGADLRNVLIPQILDRIGKNEPAIVRRYRDLARTSPIALVVDLAGDVRAQLIQEAVSRNMLLDETLGFGRLDNDPSQLERYLVSLALLTDAVKLGIRAGLGAIEAIGLDAPVQGRFQDDETFLREYPIKMTVRGSSQSILDFLASLSDPEAVARLSGGSPGGAQARRLLPVASMRNFGKDRTTRGDDAMQAEITLRALRVSTEAEVQ